MPKLADYGMAIETYDGDPQNPAEYTARAISLYKAPVYLAPTIWRQTQVTDSFAGTRSRR